MDQTADQPIDVAVVGAGPVGLFLARELIRRGHAVRLFEKNTHQSEHSKALAIMPRTMEVFELAGVVAPFEAAANRVIAASIVSHKRELGRIPFAPHESRYPYVAMVPQDVTERLLHDALIAAGGRVEYATELVRIDQRNDGATLHLAAAGVESACEARFVVGCDGAHSTVRHLMDVPFAGNEYAQTFLLVDAEISGDQHGDAMQLCPHESGPLAIFPMSVSRRRLIAMVPPDFPNQPTLEQANDLLLRRGPRGLRAEKILWSSTFRIHHRQTPHMQQGRLFIAGDASHIHSPFGAQGMNTGLQDAWNLAWKLDFVLRGWGSDGLLDTYSLERHPIAKSVIFVTDAITRAMSTPNMLAQTARDTFIPLLTRLAPFRRVFVSNLSELGVSIGGSPIVDGPGRRAADAIVRIGGVRKRTYEVLGDRYLLICPAADAAVASAADALARNYGNAVSVCTPGTDDERRVRLVRPDAYVAYDRVLGEGAAAFAAIRRLLRTQVRTV
ncbi:MAG: FAD-dependent monooxygenase [Candidatus Velthaea sp.]|jgi:2-polyprenyl-6-methoxyphenol hydroxylase-like FAD-dependent oxidoreductase